MPVFQLPFRSQLVFLVAFVLSISGKELFAQNDTVPQNATKSTIDGPLDARESLKHFKLPEDLEIELVACEPEVVDPVAAQFDASGRLWVVEMRDYPHGPSAGEKAKSQIRVLEDRDGDGFFEQSTTFADQLLFPTELQLWRDGAIVTLSGKIVFLRDTDGDLRADHSEDWYSGFAEENTQLRANHPRLGYDGQIYVANGLRGGTVFDVSKPDQKLALNGLDFRFNPNDRSFQAASGLGQFGLTFDDWNNRFVCSNRNPLIQIVLEDRWLKYGPKAGIAQVNHDAAKAGEASRIYPISKFWTTSNLHAGQFTAACGCLIYRGDLLPQSYYGNSFTCDPTGNLVHCERLQETGVGLTGTPLYPNKEFLATEDTWFRPVNLNLGPDGALYVVDMYRAVIEHPQFMPEELQKRPDLMEGIDRGRIYRIKTKGKKGLALPKIDSMNALSYLSSPNGWTRDTAFRLAYEDKENLNRESLEKLFTEAQNERTQSVALWLLHHNSGFSESIARSALQSKSPAIVDTALQILEYEPKVSEGVSKEILALLDSASNRVAFRAFILTAQYGVDSNEAKFILKHSWEKANDSWLRNAAKLSLANYLDQHEGDLFEIAKATRVLESGTPSEHQANYLRELLTIGSSVKSKTSPNVQFAYLLESLKKSDELALKLTILTHFLNLPPCREVGMTELVASLPANLKSTWASLIKDAEDESTLVRSPPTRTLAVRFLGLDGQHTKKILDLACLDPDEGVRIAAHEVLAGAGDMAAWTELVGRFSGESPAVRIAVLQGVLRNTDRIKLLLDNLENGSLKFTEIPAAYVAQLQRVNDPVLAARVNKLQEASVSTDRVAAFEKYKAALELKSDPVRGRDLFKANCSTCHRVGDLGTDIGPDISDSRVKTSLQILTDVLQPNRAIDANFVSYVLTTSDGATFSGIIVAQSSSAVSLKQQDGKVVTIQIDSISQLSSTGLSLMPEGLEKNLTLQDMADLVSFVKNWRYLDGRTPGVLNK